MTPTRSRARLTAALMAGALLAAAPAAPAAAAPERGSIGIGDDYFPLDGNGGYDVKRYVVRDRWRPASGRLTGRTRMVLVPDARLRSFHVDLLLPVRSVRVDGRRADHRRVGDHDVRVVPRRPLAAGVKVSVTVRYAGRPGRYSYPGGKGWWRRGDSVLAMGEPHTAPWWFAANDHPSDAAHLDLAITVPRGQRVIANGLPAGRTARPRTTTWRWRTAQTMATYNAFFAAGRFAVERGRTAGVPWLNAVDGDLPASARRDALRRLARIRAVLPFLRRQLGDYPFDAAGGLVLDRGQGYALENQTRPIYPGAPGDGLIVHELGHQWVGDSVRVRRWSQIWLNEGLATWLEWRWSEAQGQRTANEVLAGIYRDGDTPDGPVLDPGVHRMWGSAVYARGGMAVQALRNRIGEADFTQVLRSWTEQRRGRTATTRQLQALAEQVSGEDLDGFFHAWLVERDAPADTEANGLGSLLP